MGAKNFLSELFDANFNRFVTTSIVKILYIIGLTVTTGIVGLFALAGIVGSVLSDVVMVRIFGPFIVLSIGGVLYLLGAMVSRLICESLVVAYRIAENTAKLVAQGESSTDPFEIPYPDQPAEQRPLA